jgi:hypothetical protein
MNEETVLSQEVDELLTRKIDQEIDEILKEYITRSREMEKIKKDFFYLVGKNVELAELLDMSILKLNKNK